MRFKVDENLPVEVARLLRENDYDAHTVHEEQLTGARDEDILKTCMKEGRILITLDLDFADIRNCPPGETPGILVIRMNKQDKRTIIDTVGRLLKIIIKEQVAGKLWIVEENRIRIRE